MSDNSQGEEPDEHDERIELARKHLRAIERKRGTPDGKACVRMAALMFDPSDTDKSAEARQWIKLSLDCDKAEVDGNVLKGKKRTAANKARRATLQGGLTPRPMGVVQGGKT